MFHLPITTKTIHKKKNIKTHNINKTSSYAVKFINVKKTFTIKKTGTTHNVFNHLSFDIERSKITAILGPSGTGKTTIARIINGLEEYDNGQVIVNGILMTARTRTKIRKKTAFIFQNFNLFPNMSVLENIIYTPVHVLKQQKNDTIKIAKDMLKTFNILNKIHCYPGELSGGQKQKVAIIRALILNPEILIMDEPTASLDPEITHEVIDIIHSIKKMGITVIIITHDLAVARKASDNILMLHAGKCVDAMKTKYFFDKTKKKSFYGQRFLANCE